MAKVLPIPKTRSLEVVTGAIDRDRSSLSASLDAAGETIDLALALADIFGGEIDFSTELQPGDRFELTVEKQFRDDHVFAGYGAILAAEFDNAGRHVKAVRFTPEGGSPGYFDEHGVSMQRFFLTSPLKFQPVVTSGFSRARLHPILRAGARAPRRRLPGARRARPSSPSLTASWSQQGRAAHAGRMVHLRHANGYESEYLHLSSIAVHAGERVRQGDLIGRVGSTGLATGPHLDYRLRKNGAFVNPRHGPPSHAAGRPGARRADGGLRPSCATRRSPPRPRRAVRERRLGQDQARVRRGAHGRPSEAASYRRSPVPQPQPPAFAGQPAQQGQPAASHSVIRVRCSP